MTREVITLRIRSDNLESSNAHSSHTYESPLEEPIHPKYNISSRITLELIISGFPLIAALATDKSGTKQTQHGSSRNEVDANKIHDRSIRIT